MKAFVKYIYVAGCLFFLIMAVIVVNGETYDFSRFGKPISLALDEARLQASDLPEGYSFGSELNCYSIQAATFYQNPGSYDFLTGAKFDKKDFQSIQGTNSDNGSILYLQYKENLPPGYISFIKNFVWSGSSPSEDHPEEMWVNGRNLIIWSLTRNSPIKQVSQKKLYNLLVQAK